MFVLAIKQRTLVFTFAALCLVIFPHLNHIGFWAIGAFVSLGLWRIAGQIKPNILPHHWILMLFTLGLASAHFVGYGTLFGRDVGVSLLIVMAGLKLMETRTKRDAYMVIFLGLFLVITNFLYSQAIGFALYLLVALLLLTACMIDLSAQSQSPSLPKQLKLSLTLLLQALPLCLVLFVLFPRIPGPLWVLPEDAKNARTGLSEEMSPGKISNLIQNPAVAFRVTFTDPMPITAQRYWRGIVLWHYDGRTWRRGQHTPVHQPQLLRPPPLAEQAIRYTVTLEPHNKKWLFGLDMPYIQPPNGVTLSDYSTQRDNPVSELYRYDATSYLQYHTGNISQYAYQRALQLPPGLSQKVIATAQRWRQASASNQAYIDKVLKYFHDADFTYTLRPPLLGQYPTEDFLFRTKKGFCEHYASAFTLLMRAAGIPARVVTGYQGGDHNKIGNYMIVRQSDAHAWSEVWLPQSGWTRIDPTAAVAPERIERPVDPTNAADDGSILFEPKTLGNLAQLWRDLGYRWDAVNHTWNDWFLGYDQQLQQDFLKRLGLDIEHPQDLIGYLGAAFALVFLVIFYVLLNQRPRKSHDPVVQYYLKFCQKMAKQRLTKQNNEGPDDYRRRIIARYPSLKTDVDKIIRLYIQLRYEQNPDHEALALLKHTVAQFRPERLKAR